MKLRDPLFASIVFVSVVLFVNLLSLGQTLSAPSTQNSTPTTSQAISYRKLTTTEVDGLLTAWNDVGKQQGVSPEVVKDGDDFLRIGLQKVEVAHIVDSKTCWNLINTFVIDNKRALTISNVVPDAPKGAARWMAFCIVKWLNRPLLTEKSRSQLVADYDKFDKELVEGLEKNLLSAQDTKDVERIKISVDAGFIELRKEMDKRVEALINNPLFPAFKNGLDESHKKAISHDVLNAAKPPLYGIVDKMMATPDEAFAREMQKYFTTPIDVYLISVTELQVDPLILHTKYWGDILYAAQSQDGPWPMVYYLRKSE